LVIDFWTCGENYIMRVHEGDFAYDIEQQRDPMTQLLSAWRFTIFHLRPVETVVTRGQAKTREEAEKQARQIVAKLVRNPQRAA
jgi:hypothetical protein